jgi:predicted DCC family thiol-disulfide oxidoreductase YuxK
VTRSSDSVSDLSLQSGPVLLYDGQCGVCNHAVQWILAHERSHALRFSALQSALGQSLIKSAGVTAEIDSLLWIEWHDGSVTARKWSDSIIAVLNYVGGPWRLLAQIRWIPSPLRDAAYRLFAKHRLRIAASTCLVPTPATRQRFLDGA